MTQQAGNETSGFFLDIFPHAKPTRVGKTLSFFKNSLSLSWNSLSFLKICLSLVKKMSFGAIFLENFHTKLNKLRKIWLLVGKFLSFLTNLLEFSGKIAWVFSGSALSFFSKCPKKPAFILKLENCDLWLFTDFCLRATNCNVFARHPYQSPDVGDEKDEAKNVSAASLFQRPIKILI